MPDDLAALEGQQSNSNYHFTFHASNSLSSLISCDSQVLQALRKEFAFLRTLCPVNFFYIVNRSRHFVLQTIWEQTFCELQNGLVHFAGWLKADWKGARKEPIRSSDGTSVWISVWTMEPFRRPSNGHPTAHPTVILPLAPKKRKVKSAVRPLDFCNLIRRGPLIHFPIKLPEERTHRNTSERHLKRRHLKGRRLKARRRIEHTRRADWTCRLNMPIERSDCTCQIHIPNAHAEHADWTCRLNMLIRALQCGNFAFSFINYEYRAFRIGNFNLARRSLSFEVFEEPLSVAGLSKRLLSCRTVDSCSTSIREISLSLKVFQLAAEGPYLLRTFEGLENFGGP